MKKLLIIGNKPILTDIHELIDNYDFIVRYNKMDNSDKTGFKCDLYCAFYGIEHFLENISDEKLEIIKSYNNFVGYSFGHLLAIGKENDKNSTYFEADEIKSYFHNLNLIDNIYKFLSIVNIILYCIYKYSDEYEIYATAFDMDRTYLTDPIHKWHDKGRQEHILLSKLLLQNKFNYINIQ